MKIYDAKSAPNPRRVRIFAAEKGLDVEYVQVDIVNAESRSEDFRRDVNQMGRLPVLELDDGSHIAETMAICRYMEAIRPEPSLFGGDAKEIGVIEMWNRRMEFHLMFHIAAAFQHTHTFFSDRINQFPNWGEDNLRQATEAFIWLNDQLADRPFIAGDNYSVADITALCSIDFAKVVKLRMSETHPHLARWHEQVSARPSAAA